VNLPVIAIVICTVLFIAFFHFLFIRLLLVRRVIFSPGDILEEPFSPARYRAMERLLDRADESFLTSHPAALGEF
jgi:hypothetical protein